MTVNYKNLPIKGTNVRFIDGIGQSLSHLFLTGLWNVARPAVKYGVRRLFFTPPVYRLSKKQQILQSRATHFNFNSNGNTLAAFQWGQGPCVVLLHGWGGSGLQFDFFIEALVAAGFCVLCFDQAAHGKSSGKTANYFEFSDAVRDFFKVVENSPVKAVIGHSLGASAVVNYLARTKKSINTILISPALYLFEMLKATFDRYGVPDAVYTAMISDIEEKTGHRVKTENPVDLIKTIQQEILIIHDTKDTAVPYSDAWNASLGQDNIRLFPSTGLGHFKILQDRALVDHIVNRLAG